MNFKEKICKCGCGEKFIPVGSRQLLISGHRIKLVVDNTDGKNEEPKDDFISNGLHKKVRHEFEEYEDKESKGKRIDSVCIRAFMAAANIALMELGMDSLSIKKNGYEYLVERNKNDTRN